MKNSRFLIVMGLSLGLSGYAFATPCDSSTACENPSSSASTQSGWTISASGMSGLKALDSVGPTGNVTGSRYFFGAKSGAGGAATLAKGSISTTGDGTQVQGLFTTAPNPGLPTTVVVGGNLQGMLGNTAYSVYAQACPASQALDSALCSLWAKIGTNTTSPYPATVFSAPVKPTDATINTINVRTSVPAADSPNLSVINLEIDDLLVPANNETLDPIAWAGNATYAIDNTMYTNGFDPNKKYQFKGTVTYPAGIDVPTATPQVVGSFWTTPSLPGTISVSNITHCSAQITSQNSVGAPANPAYTVYNLCASGTGGSCATDQISGATSGDTAVTTINNLNPGTAYTPTSQAQVGNGDGTSAGWNSSAVKNGTNFNTLAWGGTFTVGNVTTTSADFTISGLTGASSIASWVIKANGNTLLSGSGDPTGVHTANSLIPNTVYGSGANLVQIVLTETSGCSSTLNFTPNTFTTDPFAPTAGSISQTGPRSLQANFTDGSANPNGATSTYEVQVCLDAAFTSGCASTTGSKAAGAAQQININSGIIPETQYFAQVRTRNQSRPTWPDSGWFNLGNVTTPNEAPSVVSGPTVSVWVTSATLSFTVTDNGGPSHLTFGWTVNPSGTGSPTLTSATGVTSIAGGNATNVTQLTFTVNGTYSGNVVVTDHDGTGLTLTRPWSTSLAAQTPTQVVITPNSQTVITGNTSTFNAIVCDQFETLGNCSASSTHIISGQTVNWSVTGGGTPLTQNGTVSYTYTAVTPNAPAPAYTLTATVNGHSGTAAITVVASGPHVDSLNFSMATADNLGGTLTLVGHDNVVHSVTSNYTASDPSVTFAPNSTTSADGLPATTAVTFSKAGTFTLTANLGSGVSSSVNVVVTQVLKRLIVSPNNVTISMINSQTFTASGLDQFNNSMTLGTISWSGSGVSPAGVFHSNSIGSHIQITATSSGVSGTAFVSVVNYDVSGAHPFPVPWKSTSGLPYCFTGLGSSAKIRIFTATGRQVFNTEVTPVAPGTNTCDYSWNVKNNSGESLASGVYLYVIESPTTTKNGKLIIIQ